MTATHLAVLAIANVRAGDPFNVTVEGRDANNNVAENFTGNVNLNAAATGGSNFNGGTANVAAAGRQRDLRRARPQRRRRRLHRHGHLDPG